MAETPTTPTPASGKTAELQEQVEKMGEANWAAAMLSVKTAIDVTTAKAPGDAAKNIR